MNSLTRKNSFQDLFVPTAIISILYIIAIYLHPLGFFLSIFFPFPVICISLEKGTNVGMLLLAIVTTIGCVFGGYQYGVVLLEYGVMGVVIGEAIRRGYPLYKIISLSVFVSLVVVVVVVGGYSMLDGSNPYTVFIDQLSDGLDKTFLLYKEAKIIEDNPAGREYFEKIKILCLNSFPAIIIATSIFEALLNYILARSVLVRYKRESYFTDVSLSGWQLPEYFIWLLIAAGAMVIIPVDIFNLVGLNLLIVMLLLYYLQGIAIVAFYIMKSKLPLFFKVLVCFFVATQVFFITIVIGLGIFDLWVDFRRLKTVKE